MALFADWTLNELTGFRKELSKAVATGALMVRYADRSVQYRDLDQMRETGKLIDDAIVALGASNPLRRIQVGSKKGFV